MKKLLFLTVLALAFCCSVQAAAAGTYVHHEIRARVVPDDGTLEAVDRITVPGALSTGPVEFVIYEGLKVRLVSGGARLVLVESGVPAEGAGMDRDEEDADGLLVERYRLEFDGKAGKDFVAVLEYEGRISFPVLQSGSEYARGFSQTPGIISKEGVFLAGSSCWIPDLGLGLITFELTAVLPGGWSSVSQGTRIPAGEDAAGENESVSVWDSPEPMEEVYLVAAKFTEYSLEAGGVQVMAFLRTPDEGLADKYLETTGQYLEMYRNIIGDYPFTKFALVENFWETGYGMPSFTLLGEKVIRFPFILHSSYPHELLHNYWGNSVYVDFDTGNWCEGLTAYMADHLIKEQRGQGAEYRRDALRRYTDYVRTENDFPLTEFRSRHDAATEAVGYGKSMMMWHMLRRMTGDEVFIDGIRKFYADNRFRAASFDDLRRAFEDASGRGLVTFFRQWVGRTGAPELRLLDAAAGPGREGFVLKLTIEQAQEEPPYRLEVPVAVSFADSVVVRDVVMYAGLERFSLSFRDRPLSVHLDPLFDVFRRLDHMEIPPALSGAFGASRITIVLPSREKPGLLEGYRKIASRWAEDSGTEAEIVVDDGIASLPVDRSVWLLGRHNRFRDLVDDFAKRSGARIAAEGVKLGGSELDWAGRSFAVVARHPADPSAVAVWLAVDDTAAVAGLMRKLPHYGKYGYLAFEGGEPDNIVKGQWEAVDSPMSSLVEYADGGIVVDMDSRPAGLDMLPKREPLAMLAPLFSRDRMAADVKYLSSEELEGRLPGTQGARQAARYIASRLEEAGLSPAGDDGTWFQSWEAPYGPEGGVVTLENVIGVIPGSDPGLPGASVVLCAHYDHLGRGWPDVHAGDEGSIHPGADDNASGVAVMIELARHLAGSGSPARNIVVAAFTAEENGLEGSRHYVKNETAYPVTDCIGAINLDTVGRLGDGKVFVLGASSAREWRFIFIGGSYVTGVESEIVTKDIDASDNVSFVEAGVPAVQLFTGPHGDYHRPTDTFDRVDAGGLVKVASLAREAVAYLSERKEPLDFRGEAAPAASRHAGTPASAGHGGAQGRSRKVGTGCMPDFAYRGEGMRVGAVSEGSPADLAGILPGDVIIAIGGREVAGLKEYSEALKGFSPGDETVITVIRGGERLEKKIVLEER